ncbi:MAG: YARHG domain-containing protein [Bacteroidaceae bacterium]|nr:YARHG domain-containing protein [Bacteroidaceae bacterium]
MKQLMILLTMLMPLIWSCDSSSGRKNDDGNNVTYDLSKPVDAIDQLSNEISSASDEWNRDDWDNAADNLEAAINHLPSPLADDEIAIIDAALTRMSVYADRHKRKAESLIVVISNYKKTIVKEVISQQPPVVNIAPRNGTSNGTPYDWLAQRELTYQDLAGLSRQDLRILRNAIYARHGRIFKDAGLRQFFNAQSWYVGYRNEIPVGELNKYEQRNIQIIQSYE